MILYAPRRDWTDSEPKSHGKNDLLGEKKKSEWTEARQRKGQAAEEEKKRKEEKKKKIGLGALEEDEVVSSQR
jgi:hypothetical protein